MAQQAVPPPATSQKLALLPTQSLLAAQVEMQPVPSEVQPRLFGQATPPLETQVPVPLQALAVSVPPLHELMPQDVAAAGYWHAPLVSQAVAPQIRSPVVQAALQQLPVPFTPQAPEPHESFSVHAVPAVRVGTQEPPEHQLPVAQSAVARQLVLQVAPSVLQMKLPGQGAGVPATQVPLVPSQALAVSVLPVQVAVPQAVVFGG